MNKFYDLHAASDDLTSISSSRLSKDTETGQNAFLTNTDLSMFRVLQLKHPVMWKLVDTDGEEALFRIPGILCQKDLPPVVLHMERTTASRRARRYIRQHVKLIGANDQLFNKALDKIQEIFMKFSDSVDETTLEPWEHEYYDGFPTIQANTRYFTPVSMSPASSSVPFAPHVDPYGHLARAMGSDFVHAPDNQVDYYQRVTDTNRKISYGVANPIAFKIGDIVEIVVAFAVVPVNTQELQFGKKKLVISLRAIALLNSDQRNTAAIKEVRDRCSNNRTSPTTMRSSGLKRQIRFTDEDDTDDATIQLKRMCIS